MGFKPLPIGIDNFEKLISGNYYYVDKTWMIKELWEKKGEVNLFTRPRRFGKTLNMSMLQYFFENTGDEKINQKNRQLFNGLNIMNADEKICSLMTKFPVITLSLKSTKQPDYNLAIAMIKRRIGEEFRRHQSICSQLGDQKNRFERIMQEKGTLEDYIDALTFLSFVLKQHYKQNVIILIDEYDVPLENAYFNGFYEEMALFIRSLFESVLKTNPCLEFAVVTGCLRISKESIFTGLNNLNVVSIVNSQYDEYYGFQQKEIDTLLRFYKLESKVDNIKQWYDGYLFGENRVYNPWSVINYVNALTENPDAFPKPYWSNTSSNNIVKDLIRRSGISVRHELETILAGGTIEKPLHEDITYDSIYDTDDHLWNFLFFTGYLKQVSMRMDGAEIYVTMAVPNLEVKYIYDNTIRNWFRDEVRKKDLSVLYTAMLYGDESTFQRELTAALQNSISYLDSGEAFYHGFMTGILGNLDNYLVKSNRETGAGRSDLVIRSLDVSQTPVILELKISDTFMGMDSACNRALRQIEEKGHDSWLPEEGYQEVWNYGISFFKKQCRIKVQKKVFDVFC